MLYIPPKWRAPVTRLLHETPNYCPNWSLRAITMPCLWQPGESSRRHHNIPNPQGLYRNGEAALIKPLTPGLPPKAMSCIVLSVQNIEDGHKPLMTN
jgi:hypothetical protein